MVEVLLIEDEEIIRNGLKTMLESLIGGVHVAFEAVDAEPAVQLFRQSNVDFILCDIRLKNSSGMDAIEEIRKINKTVPIIIVSGFADFEYARQALKFGVTEYILKPVDRLELTRVVTGIVNKLQNSNPECGDNNAIIRRVKEIVDDQLDQDLSLTSLADQVQVNHQYLSKLFKDITGENFSRFLTEKRIDKSRKLLLTTSLKVYEIAELCGYRNTKYFMSVFKEETGYSPGAFRNSGGTDSSVTSDQEI